MSLKRNLLANYLGQAYTALIGLVMLPVYVRYMGVEAYGLVGFFTMLQAWFQLFDLGLTPTLARELSRFRAGVMREIQVATMIRSTECFFAVLGIGTAFLISFVSGWIARDWLKAERLSFNEMKFCVGCMGGVLASRGLVGLYRSGLAGLEHMLVLNVAGAVLATLRSIGVLAVFSFGFVRPSGFFAYQLMVSLVELGTMKILFYRVFPMRGANLRPTFQSIRGLLGMAGSMAFLAGLWTLLTQMDKLVLSWALDLHSYGFYTVAVTLAGGIGLLSGPMSQTLQPRFSVLAAQGQEENLTKLYRTATQVTSAAAFAMAGVMACFAGPILRAWTGSFETAQGCGRILALYALGNAVTTILALAFLVQFALGELRWHLIGNSLFAAIWLPGVYLAAREAGAVGAGWVWLGGNLAYLFFWLPQIHRRLLPNLRWRWLVCDFSAIVLTEAVVLALVSRVDLGAFGRIAVFSISALVTTFVALAGLLVGTETRAVLLRASRYLLAIKAV